jgi:hypothetical protein
MAGFDNKAKSIDLLYLHANNLYGWNMVQDLQYQDIRLENELTLEQVLNTADDARRGYTIEVYLAFPQIIHAIVQQTPHVQKQEQQNNNGVLHFKKNSHTQTNSTPHYNEHANSCINSKALKYVVQELGFTFDKLDNVAYLKQNTCMDPYSQSTNALSTHANHDFVKYVFKLVHSSVFGKNIQNVRKQKVCM